MIESLFEVLSDGEPIIKLYFLKRQIRGQQRVISYMALKTRIDGDLKQKIERCAKKELRDEISKNPEYIEYGTLPYSEGNVVETINVGSIPYLKEILEQLGISNTFTPEDSKKDGLWTCDICGNIQN